MPKRSDEKRFSVSLPTESVDDTFLDWKFNFQLAGLIVIIGNKWLFIKLFTLFKLISFHFVGEIFSAYSNGYYRKDQQQLQ